MQKTDTAIKIKSIPDLLADLKDKRHNRSSREEAKMDIRHF